LAGRQNKIIVEKIDFIQAVERSIAVSYNVSWNIDRWTFSLYSCGLAGFGCQSQKLNWKF